MAKKTNTNETGLTVSMVDACTMELAGAQDAFNLSIDFKTTVDEKTQNAVMLDAFEIFSKYQNITKGYYELLPVIARAYGSKGWKEVATVKSFNDFLIQITGCSKATASELKNVAERCYTSTGKLIEGFEHFTYSELTLLARIDDNDVLKDALEIIKGLGDKRTRKDVAKAISDSRMRVAYSGLYLEETPKPKTEQVDDNDTDSDSKTEGNRDGDSNTYSNANSDSNTNNDSEDFTPVYSQRDFMSDLAKLKEFKLKKAELQEIAAKLYKLAEAKEIGSAEIFI